MLQARNLYKIFGKRAKESIQRLDQGTPRSELGGGTTAAVIDASFDVAPGEIFVVMGLSGSGKSTLIRMLNGLLEPTAGTVHVQDELITGIPYSQLREVRKEHISMVFQHFALLPHKTVLENAAYALEIQGMSKQERSEKAMKVLEVVGLGEWADQYPHQLSGGMKQRVGLARALAADTKILLMDEAFSALDPLIRHEMQEQLLLLQAELNKTIIFITHDLNEAMFLGDRIAVMRDGRIVQIGTPEDILTDPANDYVAQFVQDVDRARVLTAASVMEPARAVVSESAGPRAALKIMRDLQTSAVYVVNRSRQLQGVALDDEVLKTVRRGERTFGELHPELTISVTEDTQLTEVIPAALESNLPLAVVDEKNTLVGVIPTVTLLAALGNISTNTDEHEAIGPPNTVPLKTIDETLQTEEPAPVEEASSKKGGEA